MHFSKFRYFLRFSIVLGFFAMSIAPEKAAAKGLEVSFGFSFNRSNYSDTNFSWNRRWGASLGYELTELTELELSFQDVVDRTSFAGYEDTRFHDQIFSINWVQNLLGKNAGIQPYAKVGVGQLNRDAEGSYWYGGFRHRCRGGGPSAFSHTQFRDSRGSDLLSCRRLRCHLA